MVDVLTGLQVYCDYVCYASNVTHARFYVSPNVLLERLAKTDAYNSNYDKIKENIRWFYIFTNILDDGQYDVLIVPFDEYGVPLLVPANIDLSNKDLLKLEKLSDSAENSNSVFYDINPFSPFDAFEEDMYGKLYGYWDRAQDWYGATYPNSK